jgi:hypothetical protein
VKIRHEAEREREKDKESAKINKNLFVLVHEGVYQTRPLLVVRAAVAALPLLRAAEREHSPVG